MSEPKIYQIQRVPIDSIKPNPFNPRIISEEKFEKLVKSIIDAPWMLQLRPIVVDQYNVIIGGNQRYKACLRANLKDVWIICADDITDEEKKRFILRDNIDFGKFDQQLIRRDYNEEDLILWGVHLELLEVQSHSIEDSAPIPTLPPMGDDAMEPPSSDFDSAGQTNNFKDNTIKLIAFFLPEEIYEEALRNLDSISQALDCDDNSEVFLRLLNYYEYSQGMQNEN